MFSALLLAAAAVACASATSVPESTYPPLCCKALTASCQACAAGVTVLEYCAKHPHVVGCPIIEPPKPTLGTPPPKPTNACDAADIGNPRVTWIEHCGEKVVGKKCECDKPLMAWVCYVADHAPCPPKPTVGPVTILPPGTPVVDEQCALIKCTAGHVCIPGSGCVAYNSCAEKQRGAACTQCHPTDTNCIETKELKTCQDDMTTLGHEFTCMAGTPAGPPQPGSTCSTRDRPYVQTMQHCGKEVVVTKCHCDTAGDATAAGGIWQCAIAGLPVCTYNACADKNTGDACTLCAPWDRDCIETRDTKTCSDGGVCKPGGGPPPKTTPTPKPTNACDAADIGNPRVTWIEHCGEKVVGKKCECDTPLMAWVCYVADHAPCSTKPTTKPPPVCCEALNAQCLACAAGLTEAEYCAKHPGTPGCKIIEPVCAFARCAEGFTCVEGKGCVQDRCSDQLAEQQRKSLSALDATLRSTHAFMADILKQMRGMDFDTAALEASYTEVAGALKLKGC